MKGIEMIAFFSVPQLIENQSRSIRQAAQHGIMAPRDPRGGGPRGSLSAPACEATPHFGADQNATLEGTEMGLGERIRG